MAVLIVAAALAAPAFRHNENRTWDLVRALADGHVTIDADAANTIDKAARDGRFYSGGAPGLAFVLLPVYVVAHAVLPERLLPLVLTLFGAALPIALSALGVRRAVLRLGRSPDEAHLAAIASSLGTLALPLGTRLYAHALVIALFSWALALALGDDKGRRAWLESAAAGFLTALAVTADYNVAIAAGAIGIVVLVRRGLGPALAFAAGCVPHVLWLGAYHQACFGAPWKTPYDFHAEKATQEIVRSGYGFSWPRPAVVLELLFGPRRGFLFSGPVALAGFVGLFMLCRATASREKALRAVAVAALGAAIVVVLQNAARALDWHAGQSFGPRYCAAALPFLALGYPAALARLGRAAPSVVAASAAVAFVGATSEWGYWFWTSADTVWTLGPRAPGACVLLIGTAADEVTLASSVLSAVVLALAIGIASGLLIAREGNAARDGRAALAVLAPALGILLLAAPGIRAVALHPKDYPRRTAHAIVLRDVKAKLATVTHPAEAANFAHLARSWALDAARERLEPRAELELERAAWIRVLELEPGAPGVREEIAWIDSHLR